MIIYDCEQRSGDWLELRRGVMTASNAHRLLTPAKRKTYQVELLAEILTGNVTECYVSEAMQWGIDQEPFAIEAYKEFYGAREYHHVGFIKHSAIPNIGCSPDLMVSDNQGLYLIEIKCLSSKNHLDAWINEIDDNYYAQIQFQMLVTEYKNAEYMGFDPRFPKPLNMYVKNIKRDEKMINKLEEGIYEVNSYIDGFLMEHGLTRQERPIEVAPNIVEGFF